METFAICGECTIYSTAATKKCDIDICQCWCSMFSTLRMEMSHLLFTIRSVFVYWNLMNLLAGYFESM